MRGLRYVNITQEGVRELPKEYKEKNYSRGVDFSYILLCFVVNYVLSGKI